MAKAIEPRRAKINLIDGVIFDLFGTLTGAEPDREQHTVALAKALGVPVDDLRIVLRDSFDGRAKGQYGDLRETLATLCKELGLMVTPHLLDRAVRVRMASELQMLQPREGAIEVLRELRDHGFKVGLLSDCTPEILDLWPDLPYAAFIDCAILSCDVGWRKPDARMYEAVLQGLGLDAASCVYVGDGGSSELSGAQTTGIHTILLRVPGETYYRYDAESDWRGETIENLAHLIRVLEVPR